MERLGPRSFVLSDVSAAIAVAARKGGVGKTVVACDLASALAHQGRRVLIIDLDPQSNAAYVLGVDPIAPGTAELFRTYASVTHA